MKFRVSPKDFTIFVIFCIFLLYLCAIAVINFSSFANDGTFYGLNPFPAFGPDYLVLTLFMFFMSLVMIFSSVSSYIFEKDKGSKHFINVKNKEEKGYSRWAKDKEIKEDVGVVHVKPGDRIIEGAGIPLINNGTDLWVDNSEYHTLVIGTTGSGKSESVIKPQVNVLAKKGESMIITDPKGELYKYCGSYLKEQGYNIIVLNFRDPQDGNAWNPLTAPYKNYIEGNRDKATELLDDIATNILVDPKNKESGFWEHSAADYFSALALGLFKDAKESEVNLNSINYMSTVGEERFGSSHYINEYFNFKGAESPEYIFASNTINAPSDTKGGILSTFRQKIRLFSSREKLSEMLSYSDFDMRSIGEKRTAVFLIIHDEKTTYHSLLTVFLKQCYETLIDVAKDHGGKLPIRTNFILDEFANMPPLNDVDSMVSAARSRQIRFTFVIQNFAQLNDVYGKEVAEIVRGNCRNWIYLISTELNALEEISKMCGEVKSKEKDKTASTPLVTITDLQKMKLFQAIIMRSRLAPYKTNLEPDFKMNWGIKREEMDFPHREFHNVQIFDIKKFVSEEKRKQMAENGQNGMNSPFNPFGNPMGGGMGFNPFASPMPNPMMPSSSMPNPLGSGRPNGGLSGSNLTSEEIDKMIADIDKKLKELDEEEAWEKAQMEKKNEILPEENEKPKINIDTDSIVMNDNVITDDEFFDDFFNDE